MVKASTATGTPASVATKPAAPSMIAGCAARSAEKNRARVATARAPSTRRDGRTAYWPWYLRDARLDGVIFVSHRSDYDDPRQHRSRRAEQTTAALATKVAAVDRLQRDVQQLQTRVDALERQPPSPTSVP
jgi:hypothetical protein